VNGLAAREGEKATVTNDDLDTSRWVVIIPSFNHADDTINCLQSLYDADDRPEKVIVVDDASTDDAVKTIAAWAGPSEVPHEILEPTNWRAHENSAKWLTIVASTKNSGFSASCNIGLRYVRDHTRAPFALLLNNDAAVSRSYFRDLAGGLAATGNTGLATGTIYEWDQRTVWYAGGRFNPLRAVAEHFLDVPADNTPRDTGFVCGCTMLISRRVLEEVGFLAECYSPCYCEDADYSLNVKAAGFALTYVPNAKAFHRVSSSLGRVERSPQVIYWFNRNRGYAVRRNYKGWQRAAGIAYLSLSKPARALVELLRGRPRSSAAFIKGTFAGLFNPLARNPRRLANHPTGEASART
jgi:GT2 family glycosyltransferase